MTVTIYDIAKKANVSHSTVSRVLSGKDYGKRSDSIKRKKRILEIAEAEGYQLNNTARSLVKKQSRNLCFLIFDNDKVQSGWANAYYAQLLDGVEAACQEYHYGLVINRFHGNDFASFFSQRRLGGREFDGIVISGKDVSDEMRDKFKECSLPFVTINRSTNNLLIPDKEQKHLHSLIECTNYNEVIRYAYQKGHRNIGFLFTDELLSSGLYQEIMDDRVNAGMTDCVITPVIYNGPHNFDSGEDILKQLLQIDSADRPTLVYGSYQSCISIMKEMKKHNLSCPDDISLISSCDSEACAVVEPGLSVVSPDLKKRGYVAALGLIMHFQNEISLETISCGNIIVERQSVKDLCLKKTVK